MTNKLSSLKYKRQIKDGDDERGAATIIALLVMALLMVFVTLSVSRTTAETRIMVNDTSEGRTFTAAEASLEVMTRNFIKVFDFGNLNPTTTNIANINAATPPGFDQFNFVQNIRLLGDRQQVVLPDGVLQGLQATRSSWQINTIATDRTTNTQVQLRREYYNNLVPIFQFGIFYNENLEVHPGPRFDFGGRVHTNANLFLRGGTGIYFSSRVSAKGQILTNIMRNGATSTNDNIFVKNNAGVDVQLRHNMGSALSSPAVGLNLFSVANDPEVADLPPVFRNATWEANKALFDGNLLSEQSELKLPLRSTNLGYIELIKRGKNVGDLAKNAAGVVEAVTATIASQDNPLIIRERFANKSGIRFSLADSKAKLPGCASGTGTNAVTTPCGIRLDGNPDGATAPTAGGNNGYMPRAMKLNAADTTFNYQATQLNGDRFNVDANGNRILTGREVWIKVEFVDYNPDSQTLTTRDVTEDILSLGVTEAAPCTTFTPINPVLPSPLGGVFQIETNNYCANGSNDFGSDGVNRNGTDQRSIIELQRFTIQGSEIRSVSGSSNGSANNNAFFLTWIQNVTVPQTNYPIITTPNYNVVLTNQDLITSLAPTAANRINAGFIDNDVHKKVAYIEAENTTLRKRWIVPFPIEIFDPREGLYNQDINIGTVYPNGRLPRAGVMSVVQINAGNLRRFLNGDFNDKFQPNRTTGAPFNGRSIRHTDVPQNAGWVVSVSDRRGDFDFDGEYDMEDVYGNNDGILQPGEDVNKNGILDADYANEAVRYTGTTEGTAALAGSIYTPDRAATVDHPYYRRAVRLVNAARVPGIYNATVPDNTRGFTFASENGIYTWGNVNSTGITTQATVPTPSTFYQPQDTTTHVPAAVIGDAVTILSNSWSDANSFRFPFAVNSRQATETSTRFAMIGGMAVSSNNNTPSQGGGDQRLGGGVHNFKRFLENWTNVRLNYTGSLINLYSARNNNGTYKPTTGVYNAPNRNWVFDSTFLDPNRLPPGTPFIQFLQLTGFERINN